MTASLARKSRNLLLVMLALPFLAACVEQNSLYSWQGYNRELLSYYKNPQETEKFERALAENIQAAEVVGKVPPGLYAEHGFVLLEMGMQNQAIERFKQERDLWPESQYLMNQIIGRVQTLSAEQAQ